MIVLVLLDTYLNRPYCRNISHSNPTHFGRYRKVCPGDICMENIEKSAGSNLTDERYVVDKCLEGQGKFSIAGRHFPDAGSTGPRGRGTCVYVPR